MKVLLDECLPKKLKNLIIGHQVNTVQEMGWAGLKNGNLLQKAEPVFDVMITADRNLRHQQNLKDRKISILILVVTDTRLGTLRQLVPELLSRLAAIQPGEIVQI